jgi:hypothetical protein
MRGEFEFLSGAEEPFVYSDLSSDSSSAFSCSWSRYTFFVLLLACNLFCHRCLNVYFPYLGCGSEEFYSVRRKHQEHSKRMKLKMQRLYGSYPMIFYPAHSAIVLCCDPLPTLQNTVEQEPTWPNRTWILLTQLWDKSESY